MANMSPQEQLMLELLNRARMDPTGEAKRFNINLNEGVSNGDRISTSAKQVLAGNDDIVQAANSHSKWMLRHDIFEHDEIKGKKGFTGFDPGDRMDHFGYKFSGSSSYGENISVRSVNGNSNLQLTNVIIQQHKDLFVDAGVAGRGHRVNMMEDFFREAGIGQEVGGFKFNSGTFNSSMVTQDFGRSGNDLFVTGVVYKDNVKNDNFFSVGEQVAGRNVFGGGESDKTGAGGGYELEYGNGNARTITFSLASGNVKVELGRFNENVKVDVVNGKEVWSNGDIEGVSANVKQVHALGVGRIDVAGGQGRQTIIGNEAANHIDGKGGDDVIIGGGGRDRLVGGAGADEFRFMVGDTGRTVASADRIADFNRGEGDSINLIDTDANNQRGGRQAYDFIDGARFSGDAGELRTAQHNGNTTVMADTDGDGKADFVIRIEGEIALTRADFDF